MEPRTLCWQGLLFIVDSHYEHVSEVQNHNMYQGQMCPVTVPSAEAFIVCKGGHKNTSQTQYEKHPIFQMNYEIDSQS